MSDALAAFNVLEVQVTAGLPGPPGTNGSPGQQGTPGDPDTPYFAASATQARDSIERASDAINLKDDALGTGLSETAGVAAWIARLNATYTHGTSPNVLATSRAGFIPGGLWDGNQTLSTNAFGYSLFGQGRVSQLQDVTFQVLNSSVRAGNFAIIGSGSPTGTGLDLRSIQFLGYGIDIYNKDVAVENSLAALAGGAGSSNTLIGGWYRGGRIGVSSAGNDLRLAFIRFSDATECGIDRWDAGGVHFIGNNVTTDTGPAIRWRGRSYNFTGNTTATSNLITSVSSFADVQVGDVIGSLAAGGTFPPSTRIDTLDPGASEITTTLPANLTQSPATITINQVPVEDFYVDNTFNSGRTDLLSFAIDNIATADAGASIIVTLSEPYYGLALGDDRIQLRNTGVTSYDSLTNIASQYITEITDWFTIKLNIPYVSDQVTPGFLEARNFDAEILSNSNTTNALVRDQFLTSNNKNRTWRRGGSNFNEIAIRNKTNDWFDGVRPFRGDTTNGSDVITNCTIPVDVEVRVGLRITAAGVPTGSTVVEVPSSTSIRISSNATATASSVLVRSPWTPGNIFQIPFIDSGSITETKVTRPSGPGSTVGWGQVGFFPVTGNAYMAAEGTYFVGVRAPYTAGGMANGEVAHLNELGAMNTAILMRSNTVRNMLIGSVWQTTASELSLEQTNTAATGLAGTRAGADVSFNIKGYLSTDGTTYGNSILRFYAPRSDTAADATVVMGYAVAPGNSADTLGSLFLGASATGTPTLTGNRGTIAALASNIEIRSDNIVAGWLSGTEWFRLVGGTSSNGSFLTGTLAGTKLLGFINLSTDAAASAAITVGQTAVQNNSVNVQVYSTAFTSAGIAVQDGGAVWSGAGLSGGLSVAAQAGDLRLTAAGEIMLTGLPTVDPGVPGAVYRTGGALMVSI